MKKNNSEKKSAGGQSDFLKACRSEKVSHIPVWFMRQAGRSLPGYRELRKKYDVLTLTQTPELAAEVSLEPIRLLGVDAAILFADIMLLPIAMGIDVKIVETVGPVIDQPIDTPEKISRLKKFQPGSVAFLQETIRILRRELAQIGEKENREIPLIGFSGAPFTLASYLIEGKPTRTWTTTKRFMLEHPAAWNKLMSVLSEGIVDYLRDQIQAGAQAVQLFDSWVGCLSPEQYRRYVLPHVQYIFKSLKKDGVPRIHFGTNTAGILKEFSDVDCEVIGVDWRVSLGDAKKIINKKKSGKAGAKGGKKTLQGNLDPLTILAPWAVLKKTVDSMLAEIDPKKGYIFNLGHGVPPEADDKVLKKIVQYVHSK